MFSIPSFYEHETGASDSYDHILMSSPTNLSPLSTTEAKAAAATNSHKEAERRRRKRINGHIATLKSILPNTIKTDKASLLGEAVRRVKELRKATSEIAEELKPVALPNEADELKVIRCEASGLIRATLSCEDRPEMIADTIRALKSAEAEVVRAEMSTVGGRTKSVLWVKMGAGGDSDVGLGTLRRALRMVMDKSTLLAGSGQGLPGNKRPRCYHL